MNLEQQTSADNGTQATLFVCPTYWQNNRFHGQQLYNKNVLKKKKTNN